MAPVGTGSVEEYVVAFAEGGSAAVLDQPHFEEEEGEAAHLNHVAEIVDPYQAHQIDLHGLGVVPVVCIAQTAAVDHQALAGVVEVQLGGTSAGWVERSLLGHASGLGLQQEPGQGEEDEDILANVEGTVGVGLALEDPAGL